MKNITQIQKWTRGIKDAEAKKEVKALILRDLDKGGKPKARLENLFNTGKYQSLVSNVSAMQPERYSVQGLTCELCGTHHKQGFMCRWPGKDGAQMELSVGGTCEAYLKALPGVRDKFEAAKTYATKRHQEEIVKHLDDLLKSETGIESILIDSTPKSALKAQGAYLRNWLQGVVSDDLKEELERARTDDARVDQATLYAIVELIKTQKKRPASAYQSIVKDVKLMEKEGLAPEDLHDEFKGLLTTNEVNAILANTSEHYRSFRIRNNKEAMTHGSIDTMLDTLGPVVTDSKEKVADDFASERWLGNKVYSQRDTNFLLGIAKSWHNEKEAVALEPVVDFKKKYDRFALLHAKLAYAMGEVKAIDKEQQGYSLRQRMANRPQVEAKLDNLALRLHNPSHFVDDSYKTKIEFLQRCYSRDAKITAVQPMLAELKKMADHQFLPDVERKMVDRAYKVADLRCRPVNESGHEVYRAQMAVKEGIITRIDFLDIEKLKDDATLMDHRMLARSEKNVIANALHMRNKEMQQGQSGVRDYHGVTYTLSAPKVKDA